MDCMARTLIRQWFAKRESRGEGVASCKRQQALTMRFIPPSPAHESHLFLLMKDMEAIARRAR